MPKGRKHNPELLTDTVTAILEFQQENGYLPTVRDVGKLIDRTTDPTHKRLQKCVAAGLLIYKNRHYIPVMMPCGHPNSAVVSSDEGTNYCGLCEADAQL